MAITGLIALTIGRVLFSRSRTIWVCYAASLVMTLGQSLGSCTPFSGATAAWIILVARGALHPSLVEGRAAA